MYGMVNQRCCPAALLPRRPAVRRPAVMHRHDVGMLQAGGELDLAEESVGAEGLGQFRMEHLERHRPVVAEVVSEIHHGHAAAAELALDAVLAGERGLKATQSIMQVGPGRGWRKVTAVGEAAEGWTPPVPACTLARPPEPSSETPAPHKRRYEGSLL